MKKILATIVICLLSVIGIFTFTACDWFQSVNGDNGNDDEEQKGEVKYTVTEEEWEEAFSLFDIFDTSYEFLEDIDIDKIKSKKEKLNFKITRNYEEQLKEGGSWSTIASSKLIYEMDYLKNVGKVSGFEHDDYEKSELDSYIWGDGKQYFAYDKYDDLGCMQITDIEFTELFGGALFVALVNIYAIEFYGNYSDFKFHETTNSYKGIVDMGYYYNDIWEDEIWNADVKFKNGKISKVYLENVSDEYTVKLTCTADYGVTVKIPDEILNLTN